MLTTTVQLFTQSEKCIQRTVQGVSRSKKSTDVMRQSSTTAKQNDTDAINTLTAVNINRALNK